MTAGARNAANVAGLTFPDAVRGRIVCACTTACRAGTNAVLTLYTDTFVIKGGLETRQRRVTDMLNLAEDPFIVLADVTFDEFGTLGRTVRADFAQVNLGSILFAVADTPGGTGAGAAHPQDRAAGDRLDPAIQGHRLHPPARRAKPARRAR